MSDVTILHGYRMPGGSSVDYGQYARYPSYGDVQYVPADIMDPVERLDGYGMLDDDGRCCVHPRSFAGTAPQDAGMGAFSLLAVGAAIYWLLKR